MKEIPIRQLDLTGKKFNHLTVIGKQGRINKSIAWLCECVCGKEVLIKAGDLAAGVRKSCGCRRGTDLRGRRFGTLTVIEPTKIRVHKAVVWKCSCDCGTKIDFRSTDLLQGIKDSCGLLCPTKNKMRPIKFFYAQYKAWALHRNIEFILALGEFEKITNNPCLYCGFIGSDKGVGAKGNIERQRKLTNSKGRLDLSTLTYIANGIDRIDSKKGYELNNCVPCCTECNLSKSDRSKEEFISHARRVVSYQEN